MKKKIMVIDDFQPIREVIEVTLKRFGFSVIQACDGKDALKKINGKNIDCIICDVNMPIMDGITFLENIKNNDKYLSCRFVPIMMLSSEADKKIKGKVKNLGARAWMIKPFFPRELVKEINKLVH